MRVLLVHLVWAPLGTAPLERFLEAYRRLEAGADHRLLAVLNGFEGADRALEDDVRERLARVEHDVLRLEEPVLDLEAYRLALEHRSAEWVCLCNSHSEPLADGWLAALSEPLADPGVGAVGATGSWESWATSWAPISPWRERVTMYRHFPRFPNPHLRTNALALRSEVWSSLRWRPVREKLDAQVLESGRAGFTRQLLRRGLRALVAGRDGTLYPPERWPESRTFRSAASENLLVADNRTREFVEVDSERRRVLARAAWGARASTSVGYSPPP